MLNFSAVCGKITRLVRKSHRMSDFSPRQALFRRIPPHLLPRSACLGFPFPVLLLGEHRSSYPVFSQTAAFGSECCSRAEKPRRSVSPRLSRTVFKERRLCIYRCGDSIQSWPQSSGDMPGSWRGPAYAKRLRTAQGPEAFPRYFIRFSKRNMPSKSSPS